MKICYIGYDFHRKTNSAAFLLDFLQEHSSFFQRYDHHVGEDMTSAFDFDGLIKADFDLIWVHQLEHVARAIADLPLRGRLVFTPMFDGCRNLPDSYWLGFANRDDIRVISFSSTLHQRIARLGVNSYRFQYFPEPRPAPDKHDDKRQVFFWQRANRPSWDVVKKLFSETSDIRFHLHLAGDPTLSAEIDVDAEKKAHALTVSRWFEDPGEYRRLVDESSIYIAPREFEGIGMSFLEAMAAGRCVVAPDQPTMNEYITHGVNGLLYDIDNPVPLDLSRSEQLGRAAYQSVVNGYRAWSWDVEHRLRKIVFSPEPPGTAIYQELGDYVRGPGEADYPPERISRCSLPRVSIAMVTYNCRRDVAATLETILGQTYAPREIVVVDGGSTDGTLELIESYRDSIDIFVSEPDKGVYDAMNKAARLATGDYIIFMNAGDFFYLPSSLEEAMANVFADGSEWSRDAELPDFIVGHHVYVNDSSVSELHKANDFEQTWQILQEGTMKPHWWGGIPCHQSTLTRRQLLADEQYDLDFKIAADHNFMFTQRSKGRVFAHSNSIIATYVGGGLSQQQAIRCHHESYLISSRHTPKQSDVEEYYKSMFGVLSTLDDGARVQAEAEEIRKSSLFYREWYRARYITSDAQFSDPEFHYVLEGAKQDFWPNPFFDPLHYRLSNDEDKEAQRNPFLHYLRHGRRKASSTYDWGSDARPLAAWRRTHEWLPRDLEELESFIAKMNDHSVFGLR
ncbi:glycosyltransferase [Martelella lutilitoris]|uniref:Glycosyltransferase n=1 Tax=Martelella lutilitoris TaxID=2583532 RepID=A0A5C4JTE9_9HYPH|nr:glycosyltransferase [Martelella lutilitoris]TNB48471.1 glycosyltransferase [Martelella lutilitoris]